MTDTLQPAPVELGETVQQEHEQPVFTLDASLAQELEALSKVRARACLHTHALMSMQANERALRTSHQPYTRHTNSLCVSLIWHHVIHKPYRLGVLGSHSPARED